jgi:hypothetical protein
MLSQVWPAALIWPSQFSSTALLNALHNKDQTGNENANGWTVSRTRFFCFVTLGMFLYHWIPGVIWQGLSVFAFVTWYLMFSTDSSFTSLLTLPQDQTEQRGFKSVVRWLFWPESDTIDL